MGKILVFCLCFIFLIVLVLIKNCIFAHLWAFLRFSWCIGTIEIAQQALFCLVERRRFGALLALQRTLPAAARWPGCVREASRGCSELSRGFSELSTHRVRVLRRRIPAEWGGGGGGSVPGQRGLQVVQYADGLRLHLHGPQGRSCSGSAARRVRPPGEIRWVSLLW